MKKILAFNFFILAIFAANFQLRAQLYSQQVGNFPVPSNAIVIAVTSITPQNILTVLQRVADWQLANPSKHSPTDWTQGAGDAGIMALAGISGDAKYRDAMLAMSGTNQWQLGQKLYDADDHCVGQTYAELYLLYRDNKMIAPLREKFDDILAKPSEITDLNFSRQNPRARENWSWCDSLFMGPPTWLRLYAATGDEKYLNFAVTNWWRTTDFLYDTNEHLFFRDSTYFNKREANGKKVFWSRGNGWVFAGLVRTLQFLPMNSPERPRFEKLFAEMAGKILACQQPDGLWRASLRDPESFPLKETSGSGFFTYGLAWGVNQGLLDRARFEPAVRRGWSALVNCVETDGKLTHVQPVGSDPKKFAPESTEAYGVGAFLLAGSEVYQMAVLQTSKARTVIPLIQFQDTPITKAIQALAGKDYLNIRYIFDIKHRVGPQKPEPVISGRWENSTVKQVLYELLKTNELQMVENPESGVFHIMTLNSNAVFQKFDQGVKRMFAVQVANPSNFRRDCETVEFNLWKINSYSGLSEGTNSIIVMDGIASRILDSQIYGSITNEHKLLFQADFAPNETKTFYILDASALAATPPPIVKTFARYVPERMDDFAWESDRTAHRMYGQALIKGEGTITSGIDAWIKKDHRLIMDEMYRTKHYHEDNGSEMDDYRVGKSCGDGGSGIWDGKKLHAPINYRNWKLITTGPIRSEFEVTYDAWDAGGGRMVSSTKRISIDAGSWMSKAQDTFASLKPFYSSDGLIDSKHPAGFTTNNAPLTLTIGVGLAERACPTNRFEFIANDLNEGWQTYWQPEDQPKGTMGVAVILPKGEVSAFTNDAPELPDSIVHGNVPQPTHEGYPAIRNLLAISHAEVGKPFTYYFGACWDRSGDFTNHVQWENYVQRFAERRDQPLQVTVGN